MRCSSPIQVFKKGEWIEVPCGHCLACRLNKQLEWATRLQHESIFHEDCIFLTLTIDPIHYKSYGASKRDAQLFMKRLREYVGYNKIRYYICSEYGDLHHRAHYHIILYGIGIDNDVFYSKSYSSRRKGWWCYCKAWRDIEKNPIGHCFVQIPDVSTFSYVAKYITKRKTGKQAREYYALTGRNPEFALMSKRPGIGRLYCELNRAKLLREQFVRFKGHKVKMPRYYEDILYPEGTDEREQYRLEKQQRIIEKYNAGKKLFNQKEHSYDEWRKAGLEQQEKNLRSKMHEIYFEDTPTRLNRSVSAAFFASLERRQEREQCSRFYQSDDCPF